MTVLVAYATRYGATRQTAGRLGAVLSVALEARHGEEVRVRPVSPDLDPGGHRALVLGAPTYRGAWLPAATEFLERHRARLQSIPVWIFAEGPLGADGRADRPQELPALATGIGARDVRVFPGALDPHRLTVADRLRWLAARGRGALPAGDFRDWEAVDAWGHEIGRTLVALR